MPIQDDVIKVSISSQCPYCSETEPQVINYRPGNLYITQNKHGMLSTGTRIHIVPNSAYLRCFGGDLPTRLAAANHHKPPPKHRKYAGFGTMGIRESIVLGGAPYVYKAWLL